MCEQTYKMAFLRRSAVAAFIALFAVAITLSNHNVEATSVGDGGGGGIFSVRSVLSSFLGFRRAVGPTSDAPQ